MVAIPGHRVVRLVGKGSYGDVYHAENKRTGRTVAVKMVIVSGMFFGSFLYEIFIKLTKIF